MYKFNKMKKLLCFNLVLGFMFFCACENRSSHDKQVNDSINLPDIDAGSIVSTISGRAPLSFIVSREKNKIFYLDLATEGYSQTLFFVTLEKINETWLKNGNVNISEDCEEVEPFSKSMQHIEVGGVPYIFFITKCNYTGTVHRGENIYIFSYFRESDKSFIKIRYTKWDGEVAGNFDFTDSDKNQHSAILEHAVKQTEELFGKQNTDINDAQNFHLKWLSENNDIHSRVGEFAGDNQWHDINFITLSKDFFDKQVKESSGSDIKNDSKYLAFAGFSNPILVYSKENETTLVLWIPENWPNGGEWGIRSFDVEKIDGDVVVASSSYYRLFFNIRDRKFKVDKGELY
jgi:hypothetical protein